MRVTHVDADPMIASLPDRSARVLVVDRDAGTADAVSAVLRHAGHAVECASGPIEALAWLRTEERRQYDIVLVGIDGDYALGDDLVHAVQEHCRDAIIILLAGYADLEMALSALDKGVYAYLMKPVDVDELRTATARTLERQHLRRALVAAQSREHALQARLRQTVDDATEDLQRRVETLARENQELREAQEQHDRFVAMVAHEMRGPLNPIIAYAQLATRPDLPQEKLASYMGMVVEHAFRLNRLIDDLRTATRLSTGQFSLQREQVDLCGAVAEVIDQFTSSIHERRFSLALPAEPIVANVDRDRVIQAVRNLMDNAVKYSAEQGAIEVRVWREGIQACISVADFGAGLSEEEMRQIFEAFARGSRGRDVAGSGLGLYITRGIAEAHGGDLKVRNRAGNQRVQGAIFTISLPIGESETLQT
jgi:signal transduction histidine kinase